jgi:ABC-2 type transport system permease protein
VQVRELEVVGADLEEAFGASRAAGRPRREWTGAAPVPVARLIWRQMLSEIRIRRRIPAFSAVNLALPVVFYAFFGLPVAQRVFPDGRSIGAHVLASFGAYAVGSVMVYSFGIGVANERAMRIDLLLRATPLPPAVHLLAKILTALVYASLSLVLLIGFGVLVGGSGSRLKSGSRSRCACWAARCRSSGSAS